MTVASAPTSVQPTDRWRGGIESMHTGVGPSAAGRSAEPHSDPAVQAVPSEMTLSAQCFSSRGVCLWQGHREPLHSSVCPSFSMVSLSKMRKCPQISFMPLTQTFCAPSALSSMLGLHIHFLQQKSTSIFQPDFVPKIQTHIPCGCPRLDLSSSPQNRFFLLTLLTFPLLAC